MLATLKKPLMKEYTFTIFIEKIEGAYVAHALEAGLLATADDRYEALFRMSKMLARHIEFAEENERPEEIYRPVAREVWERFARYKDSGKARILESSQRLLSDNMDDLMLNQNAYASAC